MIVVDIEKETINVLEPLAAPEWFDSNQRAIWDTYEKAKLKTLQKNNDYGNSVFSSPILCPDLAADAAVMVRASDKICRIMSLLQGDEQCVKDESIDDSLLDLSSYLLLAYIIRNRSRAVPDK